MKKGLVAALLVTFGSSVALAAPKGPQPVTLKSRELTPAKNSYVIVWRQDLKGESHTVTFRGSWDAATNLTTEEINHVVTKAGADKPARPEGTNFRVTTTCLSDPWINPRPICMDWKVQADKGADDPSTFFLSAPNPKSGLILPSEMKRELQNEYAKKVPGKRPVVAKAPPAEPKPPAKEPPARKPAPGIAPVKILSPRPGTVATPETKVLLQVQVPPGAPAKTVALEFAVKEGASWEKRVVVDGYDTAMTPQGLELRQEQFAPAGEWRMRARLDLEDAPWSDWVPFTIQ